MSHLKSNSGTVQYNDSFPVIGISTNEMMSGDVCVEFRPSSF